MASEAECLKIKKNFTHTHHISNLFAIINKTLKFVNEIF